MKKYFLSITFLMSLVLTGCSGMVGSMDSLSSANDQVASTDNEVDIQLEGGNIQFGSGSKICPHVTLAEANEISGYDLTFDRGTVKVDSMLTCVYVEKKDPDFGYGFSYNIQTFKNNAEAKAEYDLKYKDSKLFSDDPSSIKNLANIGEEGYFSTEETPEKKIDRGDSYDAPAKIKSYLQFRSKNYFIGVAYQSPPTDKNSLEKAKKLSAQIVERLWGGV